jgi:lipoate-protein ligase A
MRFLDVTLPTLVENLALDEALLLDAEAGGPEVFRIWHWHRAAVVLGAAGRLAEEVDESACQADGVEVRRRSSGGGAVLLGPGCLLFSLILRFDRHPALSDLHASYRFILGGIRTALADYAPSLQLAGASDLALDDRKVAGNAQQRKRTHLLHHGTILHAFDPTALARYLRMPPRQPAYRRERGHAEFVTNVPIAADMLVQRLRAHWQAQEACAEWPRSHVDKLVREKYATEAWLRRR